MPEDWTAWGSQDLITLLDVSNKTWHNRRVNPARLSLTCFSFLQTQLSLAVCLE